MNLRNIRAIACKDFRSYFTSPIAYIVMAGFLVIMGWMFFFTVAYFNEQNLQFQQYNMGKSISITDGILRPLFGNMNVILLFIIPFLTMRLIAEEKKNQTLPLLMTSPVSLLDIILGKFLSSWCFVGVLLLGTGIYMVILKIFGNPDLGPILTAYLGTFLMSGALVAVGLFLSATTENQIVAGVLTFAAGLFFWLINWASNSAGAVWGDILTYLSLINHFGQFSQGILNTTDIFFYLSFIFVGLFLTHRVLDTYRWKS
jgi:ABC-2 type transport system permease protein